MLQPNKNSIVTQLSLAEGGSPNPGGPGTCGGLTTAGRSAGADQAKWRAEMMKLLAKPMAEYAEFQRRRPDLPRSTTRRSSIRARSENAPARTGNLSTPKNVQKLQKGVARESQGRSLLEAFEHTITHRAPNNPPNTPHHALRPAEQGPGLSTDG